MKNVIWLAVVSFVFCTFVACSDNGMTAEEKAAKLQREKVLIEQNLMDSIVGGMATVIRFNFSAGGNGMYISDGFRMDRVIDTTIEINKFIKDMIVTIRFSDPSVCNYGNTKFLLNGKEIKGKPDSDPYSGLVFKDIFEKQDETHRLEILLDSAKCGNLKETYTLVPSKNPGEAHFTEVCYYEATNDYGRFIKGHFYNRVVPCYYGGFYSTYADTVQSKCFLKTESDSMELKIDFEKDYDIMNARYYQEGEVSLDSVTLDNFLKDDTSATLSCALIFQDWLVPAQVNREFKYYNKTFRFKNVNKYRMDHISGSDYQLVVVDDTSPSYIDYLFTRTSLHGEKIFAKAGSYQIRWKDVYDGRHDESTAEDSVQVLVVGWPAGSTTEQEDILVKKLKDVYWEEDSTVFATTLDSIMNVVTDEAGNIKEQFYFMDAKRVPGYDINAYKEE